MKGSFWLFVGVAIFNIAGFLYWIMASLFVSPDVIGSTSAILSFESLIINVFSLGVPIGIRRFIGSSWGQGTSQEISQYVSVSLGFAILINIPALILVSAIAILNIPLFSLNQVGLSSVALLITLDFWPSIFASLFISILRTKVTTISNSISSIVKILIGYFLLQSGMGFVGVIVSILAASLTRGGILLFYSGRLSDEIGISLRPKLEFIILKKILSAGLAAWAPNVLMIIGQTLGILIIYGYIGSTETGLYHIAFAISIVVYNLPGSIQSLMFPVLSGMNEGKESAVTTAIRLSLAITSPIALILMVYPDVLFLLLGPSYAGAANILMILMMGLIAYPVISGYSSYVYALGKYIHVTLIDLTSTLVRLFLYFILITWLASVGAAIAYVLGIFSAIVPVSISAKYTRFSFKPSTYLKVLLIPLFITLIVFIFDIFWIIGGPVILLTSTVAYTRTGVITKNDIKQMALAFLSPESVSKVYTHTRRIVMLLFGDA